LNDAKSCYDQIPLLAAALCLCHFSGSQSMVDSMITTLHKMEHHIWTTFGDSTLWASRATWQIPVAGIGQGNGAGPHIWAAMSSPLLDIMQADRFYAHMITSISHMEKRLVGFAFADDTDLVVHGPQVSSNNLHQTMQRSVDHWEGLLCATRGALVPTKCFWYGIDFQWKNNTWQYLTKQDHPRDITIQDDTQCQVQIP